MHRDLVAIGATATDHDSYVVPVGPVDVRVRIEPRRGACWVMLYVAIAHAKDRDAKRCRHTSTSLVVGTLATVGGVLLVRSKIRVEVATRAVLRTTLVMLAAEATQFEAATRPACSRVTYACFGH
ncbi:MAG: hypothetical protein ACKV2T_29245 [Kofleriaceae bacterium]